MTEQVPSVEQQAEIPGEGQEDVEMSSQTSDQPSSNDDVQPEKEKDKTQQPENEAQTCEQVQSPPDEQTQPQESQVQPQTEVEDNDELKNKHGDENEKGVSQSETNEMKTNTVEGDQQSQGNETSTKKESDGSGGFFSGFKSIPTTFRRWFSTESAPRRDRAYYESLSREERRKEYKCGAKYVTLENIPTWEEDVKQVPEFTAAIRTMIHLNQDLNAALIKKVSLWRGDITSLEIDAIVNAANSSLLGGGGVDGAIHRAAGYSLRDECATLGGCNSGDAKLTSGHRLPANYVLHTVGPMDASEVKLKSCYTKCLQLVSEHNIRSVAFCCIATGVYGFPNVHAAHIALSITRSWLETNADKVDRIIFCVFLKQDFEIYSKLLQLYFPLERGPVDPGDDSEQVTEVTRENTTTESADGKEENDERATTDEKTEENVPTLRKVVTEPAPSTSTKDSAATDGQQLSNDNTQVAIEDARVESTPPINVTSDPNEDKVVEEEEQMEIEEMETDQTDQKEIKEGQDTKRPKTEETHDEPTKGMHA